MPIAIETLVEESATIIHDARGSTHRNYVFPQADNMIKVATGMRRSGKSYFLYQTINTLLDQHVDQEQILFINFEDDRLLPMNAKEMGALIDSFYTLYPENHKKRCYLFLDEVQNVEDWNLVVRRFFDSKNVQLYLTGSSSKLLSKEIHTNLRGRSLSLEILPFSFEEYLGMHNIAIPQKPFGQASYDIMQKHLRNYFNIGGFPAVQMMAQNEWRETLQNYIDTVILKDIIERHNVTNVSLLRYLTITLLKNTAAPFSVNKFYNDIKSQGHRVSKETIHAYSNYIQDAYLIFSVNHYSEFERKQQNRPKKIYAIDNGIVNAVSLGTNDQHGKLLENHIYLNLRRQKKKIYFYTTADGYEVDFVTIDQNGQREIIQVVWDDSDPKTLEHKQRALSQAEAELGIKGGIITMRDYLASLAT